MCFMTKAAGDKKEIIKKKIDQGPELAPGPDFGHARLEEKQRCSSVVL